MGFRITTWNVNGIRNPFGYQPWREQRTFQAMFDILEADIVVFQETKIQRKDLQDDMVLVPGWDVFFSLPRHKKGYSGVVIYTRNATCAPVRAEEGVTGILCPPRCSTKFRDLPEDQRIGGYPLPGQLSGNVEESELDSEGRCVALEFPAFVLLGVYSPAARNESRDDFRLGFLEALDVRIRNLVAAGKQVVLTGDLNIVRSEMDSTNLTEVLRKEGFSLDNWLSMPSRRLFNQLIFGGKMTGQRDEGRERPVLWDLCRCFHPTREGMNTCWDTKRNTRPANNGSRIDYVLCSDGLRSWFTHADIQEGLMGSDHCPVFATIADTVRIGNRDDTLVDLINPPGMFRDGERICEWSTKDLLPLSAKLMPEFDRRRNIRDMFSKRSEPNAPAQPTLQREASSKMEDGLDKDGLGRGWAAASGAKTVTDDALAPAAQGSSQSSKRQAASTDGGGRFLKRAKPAPGSNGSRPKATSGQKTLQGFFKPASSSSASGKQGEESAEMVSPGSLKPDTQDKTAEAPHKSPPSDNAGRSSASADRVFDPIQAKESWSKLLGRRVLPRCEHNEPCISLVTKKPGVNCGRSFFICPRPLGPSGEKERGSEWRCGTFIWRSDWSGSPS